MNTTPTGLPLYAGWDNFIYPVFPFRLCQPIELLVNLPLVEQSADWHKPDLTLRPMQERYTVKNEPGKQLLVAYPTTAFFGSSSDSTSRFVPLYIASIMALLYSASWKGEVSSSTASSVSKSCLSFGSCRLCTSTD